MPEVEIELDGLGQIDAAVATSVDASVTATAGTKYEDGELSPIAELDTSFEHVPPDPQASATLQANLSSELEAKFYAVGGLAIDLNAGLELNATPGGSPWWTLDAPVSVTAGLDIDALDLEAGPITVYEKTFRLAEAQGQGWTGTITIDATESGPLIGERQRGPKTGPRTPCSRSTG